MNLPTPHVFVLTAFVTGMSGLCSATPMGTEKPETIVVTGTRTPKALYSSPVNVDIIERATIERLSRGTLRQLLEVMPGVVVTRSRKEGYNIQLQGFSADRVLVLMDGQPLISPTGSAVDLDQISVNNIKQIEIVRGAASVLYGSSAMGGVINIITEAPTDGVVRFTVEANSYTNNARDDDRWGQLYRVQATDKVFNWQTSFNFQYIDDPGFDYQPDTLLQNGAANDKTFVNLDLSRQLSQLQFTSKTRWFSENKHKVISAIPGQTALLSYQSNVEQWQQDLRLAMMNNWHVSIRALGHDETSGNTNGLRDTRIAMQELEAQKVWMGDREWIAGITLHQDQLDQHNLATSVEEVDNATRQSAEAFLQFNASWQSMQFLLGSRIQYDSDFSWHQAWRGSVSYDKTAGVNHFQWRLGAGQSYRVPNLKERYYIFDHSNLGYMIIGDDSLIPETANNLSGGFKWRMETHSDWQFTSDINVHYTDADDFIITIPDAELSQQAGVDVFVYSNVEQAVIRGFDVSLSAEHDNVNWQLNYSFLDARDGHRQRLPERPRHLLKASVTYRIIPWDADIQFYVVASDEETADSSYSGVYRDHAVTSNVQFKQAYSDHLSWQVGIENIFDQHQNTQKTQQGLFDARSIVSRQIVFSTQYQF
jgi:outer membrane receptor for ferrienterochelin and colicins